MNLNTSNLSHPRIQWSIEAAMWRAIELSRNCPFGHAGATVECANGKALLTVVHGRGVVGAFRFFSEPYGHDVTQQVLKSLRENAAKADHQIKAVQ